MDNLVFRNAVLTDAARCFEVEKIAYGGEEAATFEKISKRIAEYPEGFLVLEVEGVVVGFINSGCAHEVEMSDEDFKALVGHDPAAPNVVILSVVVDPAYQGRGLSTAMMIEFVQRMRDAGKDAIHLMCKERYVPLYEKFGYLYTRPSESTFGGAAQWHEMEMRLRDA